MKTSDGYARVADTDAGHAAHTGYGFFSSYKKMTCRMFWDDAARRLEAAALFGPLCEGPISQVHGARASQGSAGGAGAAV